MHIKTVRRAPQDFGTPGNAEVKETGFRLDTLELGWFNNERGVSCIRAGVYKAEIWKSQTLNKRGGGLVVRLEDLHGRRDCLWHEGNFAGSADLGMFAQIRGCTLTGRGYGMIERPDNRQLQMGILHSGVTLLELIRNIGGGPHIFEYVWEEGCSPEGGAQ